MNNRELIAKADLALSDLTTGGGLLQPAQARQFMKLLIKQSVIMSQATVVPMKAPKQQVPTIKFGSRVLRAGTEATALANGDRVKPDMNYVELDAQLFRAEVRLSDEVLEDQIEGGTFKDTIISLLAEAISRDMEEVIISGDTASGDAFLAKLNGLLKQATSHVHDLGAGGADVSAAVLKAMVKLMPDQYLRDKTLMRFFMSVDAEQNYRSALAERATVAGDKYLVENAPVLYQGIPVNGVPLIPGNLGGTTDRTVALLTNPKNVYVGIWRDIKIESWRDPSEGVMKIAANLRFDAKFANEDEVVKCVNLKLA